MFDSMHPVVSLSCYLSLPPLILSDSPDDDVGVTNSEILKIPITESSPENYIRGYKRKLFLTSESDFFCRTHMRMRIMMSKMIMTKIHGVEYRMKVNQGKDKPGDVMV